MSKVGLVYDPVYLKHDTGAHVENSSRLVETVSLLKKSQLMDKLVAISPRAAILDEIALVHSQSHISRVHTYSKKGGGWLDGDTYASLASYDVALQAVGGVLQGLDAVMAGEVNHAFALVRPPGHHATPEEAMGFCLFNNIAIAAAYAKRKYKLERILIADFDVHHGNGTQAVFRHEERVAFFSTQQENIYPFRTGFIQDAPHARGRIVNLPLPARAGDAAFARLAERVLDPLAERLQPEMIFVSAGFDSHWDDPLAELGLSSAGYHAYARRLVALAEEYCGGKLVCVLEGGYNPHRVASGVEAVLSALTGTGFVGDDPSPYPEPEVEARLEEVRRWNGLG
jgi:acetoin utilization deacetylase AcuC-like enzyme